MGAVASLYESSMRSGSRVPPSNLEAYFSNFFLKPNSPGGHFPSLVCVDDRGELVGFLGVHNRRLILDGRRIPAICSGPLIVEAKSRTSAIGVFLLREILSGPQELTFTDGANEAARRVWERLGGATSWLTCHEWTRVFQPLQFSLKLLSERPNTTHIIEPLRRATWPLGFGIDAMARRLAGGRLGHAGKDVSGSAEELTPESMLEAWCELSRGLRLKPDYNVDYLRWLFEAMRAFHGLGDFQAKLVRSDKKQILGYYIYYHRRGGISQVAQVMAKSTSKEEVLGRLFREADLGGAIAIKGRLEPHLVEPLARLRASSSYTPPLTLVHAKNSSVYGALFKGAALLTRTEGEWWMTFHLEPGRKNTLPE